MMSAAKMHMAEPVAAVSMATTVTSSMSATMTAATMTAAAVTAAMSAAAPPGYRAARERHSENNERNSN
jgi:hypothetical protein